jgi:hypothetical protein
MGEKYFGIVRDESDFKEEEFDLQHKDEIEQYNQSLELPIEDFEAKVNNASESDESVEECFWKIYAQKNDEKTAKALAMLEKNTLRKKVLLEVSEAIANDR